jgi:hypothetical protein
MGLPADTDCYHFPCTGVHRVYAKRAPGTRKCINRLYALPALLPGGNGLPKNI